MNEESVGMTARQCLPELLHRPLRRRVGGHVVMQDSTGAQFHDDHYVERAEGGGDHNEEVAGHDCRRMMADEGQPTLLWIGSAHRSTCAQVLRDSAGRNSN